MKTALTLTLTASLLASSLPAAAQVPFMPPPRYAQPAPPPPYMPLAPILYNWTRVRAIEPRSRIRVSAIGLGDRDHQYFVSASDRTLTLLTLGGVPRVAKRLVLTLAGSHPELFISPDKWMEFREGDVRANPDGLFVGKRKIADLTDIARTVDAGDVAEVSAEVLIERPVRDIDAPSPLVLGSFLAALYGTVAICKDKCGSAALLPIIGIPVAVGIFAARKTAHAMRVVYRVR
jgi:hypothetical protein